MSTLKARIAAKELVLGVFVKTPAPQLIEILGHAGLDFAVPDQEHAPIDLGQLDLMVMAARSVGLPLVPRSWGHDPARISPLFDMGCTGVMVPHVADAEIAARVVDAVHFGRGKRGVSPSPRAGNYGKIGMAEFTARSDAQSVVFAQIEDASALSELDRIAAVDGVDVLFVGPADLSLSLGCKLPSPELEAAILQVVAAARAAGKTAGLFVSDETQIADWHARGITVFVVGSDQSLVLKGASRIMQHEQGQGRG